MGGGILHEQQLKRLNESDPITIYQVSCTVYHYRGTIIAHFYFLFIAFLWGFIDIPLMGHPHESI